MMYSTIKNLIPLETCNRMVDVLNADTINGSMHGLEDLKKFRFDSTVYFCKIQIQIQPKIEEFFGVKLLPTYNYSRIYYYGAGLKRHRDRESCEYSVTLNLKQEGDKWPIWMQENGKNSEPVFLDVGEGAAYKGCEVWHWREENECGKCHQIFFHYVEENGPNSKFAYDKNKNLFFSYLHRDTIEL